MPSGSTNRLLASVSTEDFDWTGPRIRDPWGTKVSRKIQQANRCRLFPGRGSGSVVAVQSNGKQAEVGLISREGTAGLRSPHATKAPGKGKGKPATELHKATQTSVSLRDSLLKFAQVFGVQTTHTAICNAQSRLDLRLVGAVDGRRPSSRTVTSWASGSSDRRSREERHVRGDLPLAN
jgi:hypothetical protein